MKKFLLVLVTSALFVTMFPGAAKAVPGDTTIYPIVCATSIVDINLAFGVSAITITNPNGCSGTGDLYLFFGESGTTWTYSKTIGGSTTSGSYDPAVSNLSIGTLGSADSFTLTLTSTSDSKISAGNALRQFDMYFNKQINTFTPEPVAIGQQVTVTGSDLSSVSSLSLQGPVNFQVTTANRTATQLTFIVPAIFVQYWDGTEITVTPGNYRLSTLASKTLTITAAPIVVSVSAEELAAQRLSESMAAAAVREAEKMMARGEIEAKSKRSESISVELFARAEIPGINKENIEAVQAEIAALPEEHRGYIGPILEITRKFEVVGIIASDRVTCIYSSNLIEIGLISEDSKNKAALTALVKNLPIALRSSYIAIQKIIVQRKTVIQARQDRLINVVGLIVSHQNG